MARTTIAAQALETGYPIATPAAVAADFVWTPADTTHLNAAAMVNGKTMLFARNVGLSARHVTVTSAADPYGRLGDLGPYTLGAGKVARFGPFADNGWTVDGCLGFAGDHADVEFTVIALA